jgi:hypothetical protein
MSKQFLIQEIRPSLTTSKEGLITKHTFGNDKDLTLGEGGQFDPTYIIN